MYRKSALPRQGTRPIFRLQNNLPYQYVDSSALAVGCQVAALAPAEWHWIRHSQAREIISSRGMTTKPIKAYDDLAGKSFPHEESQ